jgi:uncharacterized protein YndB with AHSA1/START domain
MATTNIKSTITGNNDAVITENRNRRAACARLPGLTDRAQALQWSSDEAFKTTLWEMDPRPGGKWRSVSKELKGVDPNKDYDHHGEIIEFDPPRLLFYSWFANWHEIPSHRTEVRWELTPTKTGTHLKVTHSGLAQLPAACQAYSQGWPGLLQGLKNFLDK